MLPLAIAAAISAILNLGLLSLLWIGKDNSQFPSIGTISGMPTLLLAAAKSDTDELGALGLIHPSYPETTRLLAGLMQVGTPQGAPVRFDRVKTYTSVYNPIDLDYVQSYAFLASVVFIFATAVPLLVYAYGSDLPAKGEGDIMLPIPEVRVVDVDAPEPPALNRPRIEVAEDVLLTEYMILDTGEQERKISPMDLVFARKGKSLDSTTLESRFSPTLAHISVTTHFGPIPQDHGFTTEHLFSNMEDDAQLSEHSDAPALGKITDAHVDSQHQVDLGLGCSRAVVQDTTISLDMQPGISPSDDGDMDDEFHIAPPEPFEEILDYELFATFEAFIPEAGDCIPEEGTDPAVNFPIPEDTTDVLDQDLFDAVQAFLPDGADYDLDEDFHAATNLALPDPVDEVLDGELFDAMHTVLPFAHDFELDEELNAAVNAPLPCGYDIFLDEELHALLNGCAAKVALKTHVAVIEVVAVEKEAEEEEQKIEEKGDDSLAYTDVNSLFEPTGHSMCTSSSSVDFTALVASSPKTSSLDAVVEEEGDKRKSSKSNIHVATQPARHAAVAAPELLDPRRCVLQ